MRLYRNVKQQINGWVLVEFEQADTPILPCDTCRIGFKAGESIVIVHEYESTNFHHLAHFEQEEPEDANE